jgi:hypothetical protein
MEAIRIYGCDILTERAVRTPLSLVQAPAPV